LGLIYFNPLYYLAQSKYLHSDPIQANHSQVMLGQINTGIIKYSKITELLTDGSRIISHYSARKWKDELSYWRDFDKTDENEVYNLTLKNRGLINKIEYKNSSGKNVKIIEYDSDWEIVDTFKYETFEPPYYFSIRKTNETITTLDYNDDGETYIESEVRKYYNDNGLLAEKWEYNSDNKIRATKYTYANEISSYDDMNQVNMLSQLAQINVYDETISSNDARSSSVFTYDENEKWAQDRKYVWRYNGSSYNLPTFDAWTTGNPSSDQWVLASKVIARDYWGNILEQDDPYNTRTTMKWGYNDALPMATFTNASYPETLVDDFNQYLNTTSVPFLWNWTEYYTGDLNGYVSLTNDRRLRFENTSTSNWRGLRRNLSTSMSNLTYECDVSSSSTGNVFYISLRNNSGYVALVIMNSNGYLYAYSNGSSINLGSYESNKSYHMKFDVNTAADQWYLVLDGKRYGPYGCTVSGSVNHICFFDHKNSGYGIVDNIRLYPSDALCTSQSYDPYTFQITSQTDENGISTYYQYDDLGRLVTTMNNDKRIISQTGSYYSRDGNDDVFNEGDPNAVTTASFPNGVSTDGLVGFWNLDGHAQDLSGYDSHGTITNAMPKNGFIGAGYNFDGNGDFIDVGTNSALRPDWISLEAWIYPYTASQSEDQIVTHNSFAYRFSYTSNGIRLLIKDPDCDQRSVWNEINYTVANCVSSNKWNHVVATYGTDRKIRIYVNGILKGTSSTFTGGDGKIYYYTSSVTIGKGDITGWRRAFNGKIDEVKIYNRALTETEINNHYNALVICAYSDGLGREIQTQQRNGDEEIVFCTENDAFGRPVKNWKPFPSFTSKHAFLGPSDCSYQANDHYNYDGPGPNCASFFWSEIAYRNAFSDQILKQGFPGTDFRINGDHTVDYSYTTNDANEFGYAANTLFEVRRWDETAGDTGYYIETQTDLLGNLVGKREYTGSTWLNKAFRYDILGNLVKIIPPNAISDIYNPNESSSYCTNMCYNTLGQLISKDTPDADEVEYGYDKNGNLRYFQDGNLRPGTHYAYYKYDLFNRLIESGETVTSMPVYADDPNYPTAYHTPLIKYYYDANGYPGANYLTGRPAKIEYKDINSSEWGVTYYSYTDEGYIEWIKQDLPGDEIAIKTIAYEYDYLGRMIKMIYEEGGPEEFHVWYEYNQQGQLEKVYSNNNENKPGTADAIYTYWPTGQVHTLELGEEETLTYNYTTRDWLRDINAPNGIESASGPFATYLNYNYNGNIYQQSCYTPTTAAPNNPIDARINRYTFDYDRANRIIEANCDFYHDYYSSYWQSSSAYDLLNIGYDRSGNLAQLTRKNENGSGSQYTYYYNSNTNQLNYVAGLQSQNYYGYDANGNVDDMGIWDTINNDFRNLPYYMSNSYQRMRFIYDADGNRVQKYHEAYGDETRTYYIRGINGETIAVYSHTGLKFINLYGLDLIGKAY
jgi:YD repeat-containing protein